MKTILISTLLAIGMPLLAQSEEHSLIGEWELTTTMLGISSASRLQLAVAGKQITACSRWMMPAE
jgi:hypothetical protein